MMLDLLAEWSEKFATWMLYADLLARIQSHARTTSDTVDCPWSFMTSIDRRFAFGVVPV
jgi:hypothetical protein